MSFQIQRISGGKPCWFTKQPYFLKFSPLHPTFGAVHDGTTTEYGKGYIVKPMSWLYRFRYNSLPRGITPIYLRNPGGKTVHWLEVSHIKKAMEVGFSGEFRPHLITACLIIAFTIWHCGRYLFFHPELTMYMLAVYPTKVWITQHRYNEKHPLDKPVFRFGQRAPEFYYYDSYRDLIKMGVLANDPYSDYMKSIGKEKELVRYMEDVKLSDRLVDQLPFDFRRAPPGHHDDHKDHGHGDKAHH